MAITIAIANQKGGCSKTTTSIELAACMAGEKYKVLLIDLEQQHNATTYISGNAFAEGIYDVLKQDKPTRDTIISTVQETDEGFDLLSGSEKLSNANKEFSEALDVLKLKRIIKLIDDDYDFVFIDTNPSKDILLNMCYVATDFIIVPVFAESGSFDGLKTVFEDLEKYKESEWSNADILGVIIANSKTNTNIYKYHKELIEEFLQEKNSDAFISTIRSKVCVSEVKSEGTSLQKGRRNSDPAMDYRKVAKVILNKLVGEE